MVTADEARRELARRELARRRGQTESTQEGRGILRRVDDAVRGAADMLTFGFADEIAGGAGALTGIGGERGNYSGNVDAQRERDAQGGWERLGGQVAGAVAMPLRAAQSLGGAIGQGALVGGAYGFGSGDGDLGDRAQSAALGAGTGATAGWALKGIGDALARRFASRTIPDNAALRAASEAGYDAAENAGVIVGPQGMRRLATETVNDLVDFGYHPQIQPKIGSILSEMERLANTNTTFKGLDTLRKIAGQVAKSNDPTEKAMATRIIQRLDGYMMNLPADDVLTGNARQAAQGIKQGRENWARMRRSEMVDTARLKAERRADSSGTGGNLDNAIRQNVRSILDNPKRSQGMTPAEIEMAERVVRGTPTQNTLRQIGRLSPTTGGLSAMLNVGATAVNPLMAIPGAVGMAAKTAADRMTIKNANRLSQMIRSGGKTADDLVALARGGALDIPQVRRIDLLARNFGLSTAELAAAVRERLATGE